MIYYALRACEDNYNSQHKTGIELREYLFSALEITDEVKTAQSGRPYIKADGIDLSVSHSKNAVLCAVVLPKSIPTPPDVFSIVSEGTEIGADIQFVDPDSDIERLKKISRRYLSADINSRDEFYDLWTRKEAFGKLCGEGLFCKADDNGCSYFSFPFNINSDRYQISICIK